MSAIPASKCLALITAVVKQAFADHVKCLQTARRNLRKARVEKGLPAPVDSEVLAHALNQEPAQWILSKDITPWSFRWCCSHLDLDPDAILRHMNRASFVLRVDGFGEA